MAAAYLAAVGVDLDAEMARIQFALPHAPPPARTLSRIVAARLPARPAADLWDISIAHGRIAAVDKHDPAAPRLGHLPGVLDAAARLVAPSLCHAHIHLDKCFLLQDPKYSDLRIVDGGFAEAMALTGKAKARFEEEDLLRRGRQLIEESIDHGVTAMRAFVELDADVGSSCLDAGLKLKHEFGERCDVQICAFAQLPLFSGSDGGAAVRGLMTMAASREGVDVLGSTPYVETDATKMKMNVGWISELALSESKFLDLHMDYHLDETREPFIWEALDMLKERGWMERKGKAIAMGHCTRLTLFKADEWTRLKQSVGHLPVSFVGLPTSDLFMMRTTLDVPRLIQQHGLQAAIAVNNVGNAFTPQGSCDPLAVASMGVGLYQAGTEKDGELLFECVSSRAKAAIGLAAATLELKPGEAADLVVFDAAGAAAWRRRKSVAEVVYDAGQARTTVRNGRISSRTGIEWT